MSSYPQSQAPRRSRKRHKPIARVTSYDYNVRYDLRRKMETKNNRNGFDGLFAAPIHDESYDVMEGETLMSINKSQAYRDGAIHCFSFANGLGADIPSGLKRALDGPDNDARKTARSLTRYIIMSQLQLVGVAVTNFDAKRNSAQDMQQGFVANLSGLNTIVNTGDSQIRPGDYVFADLPSSWKFDDDPFAKFKKQEGIPLDKLLFATRVYDPSSAAKEAAEIIKQVDDFRNDIVGSAIPKILIEAKAMGGLNGLAGVVNAFDMQDLQGLACLLSEIDFLKKRFILGKALSHARPGEPFDIVLSGSANTA